MPTNFPTSVDNFTNPTANDSLNLPSHSTQHANANDAIEAVEDYLLNGAGKSGLVLLKTQTIGTGVSSVTVTDAFNASYDNYKIIFSGGAGSTNSYTQMTLGSTTSGYYAGYTGFTYAAASSSAGINNGSSFIYGIYTDGANGINGSVELLNPFNTRPTYMNAVCATNQQNINGAGLVTGSTSYTSFNIFPSSGTLTGGTIRVYGYRNA